MDESFVLTDANNALNKWQEEEAFEHWKRELHLFLIVLDSEKSIICFAVMREIVPDAVWETY